MLKKSVISLISYDAHLLPKSIQSYYPYVDEIVLGLDEDRITWSGNKFNFDEGKLWENLKKIDFDNKIQIIEDNFHSSPVAIENDNQERNILKKHCSHDWIFSFDADELLVNPKPFFYEYLPIVERYYDKVDLQFTWFLLYKEFEDDILYIAEEDDSFYRGDTQGFATSKEKTFTYCRWTNNQRSILSPLAVLHWSFCRTEEQNIQKLNNFGHSDKTKQDPFFHYWRQVNLNNYNQLRNFKTSGYGQRQWPKLAKLPKTELMNRASNDAKRII